MQAALSRNKRGKIPLSLAAFPHLGTATTSRVQIVLEFPWQELHYTINADLSNRILHETVGVLGSILSSDGSEVAHFTDVEGHNSRDDITSDIVIGEPVGGLSAVLSMPRRYDEDVYLPPGAYRLRIVLTDGKNFGRAEAAFQVENCGPKHPAIGKIALGRRFRSERLHHFAPLPANRSAPALVSQSIDSVPTADKAFPRNGMLHCYFDLYLPGESPQSDVSVQLRILHAKDAKDEKVAKQFASFAAAPYAVAGSSIIAVVRAIDLKGLPKGKYQLQAQVTSPSGAPILSRTADFRISLAR
jgi:hypothetical protein